MKKILFVLISAMLLMVGCSKKEADSLNSTTKNGFSIKLTAEEQSAYKAFAKDLDDKHLKDLSPISIAKLYGQSLISKDYATEYALYTNRDGFVQWSKDEHMQRPEKDRIPEEQIENMFKSIDNATFEETSDVEGIVIMMKTDTIKSGLFMVKDKEGIWKMDFIRKI